MPSPLDPTYKFYTDKIKATAKKYNIPAQLGIWQLWQESRYNPSAGSGKGAQGIAQFMPGTAAQYGVNVWDVDSSIDGWGRLMRDLYKQFGRWDYALAGYNAGPGNVNKYNGVPPFSETQNYVRIILGNSKVKAVASAGLKIGLGSIVLGLGIATAFLVSQNN